MFSFKTFIYAIICIKIGSERRRFREKKIKTYQILLLKLREGKKKKKKIFSENLHKKF